MSLTSGKQLLLSAAAGGGTTGYQISRSLRFNSSDSAYLSRTPASAGNRRTYTVALWFKSTGNHSVRLFGARTDANNYMEVDILSDYRLRWYNWSGSLAYERRTTQVLRDPSAWYHLIFAFDSTQATASNRLKLYINGTEITAFDTQTNPSQNFDDAWNNSVENRIGTSVDTSNNFLNGYLADIHFIDGQALTPTSFGEFDATTGVWNPKAYTGTYGTNGFRLPFSDNSAATATTLGKDSAGSNNWTPVNLQVTAAPATFAGSFDGNSANYWTVNADSVLDMGTGDFTAECWIKLNAMPTGEGYSSAKWIFGTGPANSAAGSQLYIGQSNLHFDLTSDGSNEVNAAHGMTTNTWYHVAVSRSGTSIRGFVNGQQKGTTTTTSNSWVAGANWGIGAAEAGTSLAANFNGQISNLRIVKGSALYTSNFTPPSSPLTAVSGTSLLTLRSSTATDISGNGLVVTSNGSVPITGAFPFGDPAGNDSLVDSPTNGTASSGGDAGGTVVGNYATLNPLAGTAHTYTNGSLDLTISTSSYNSVSPAVGTIAVKSGKWYFEFTKTSGAADAQLGMVAVESYPFNGGVGNNATSYAYYLNNGYKINNSTQTSYGNSVATNDIVGVAIDLDNGKIWFSKNGTWQASGDPAAGTNAAFTGISNSYTYAPAVSKDTTGTNTFSGTFNFGSRSFAYAAPSGFKSLNTANLPTPTILKGSDYFDTKLYTGNGSTQTISGLAFSPDFVWAKGRSIAADHGLFDIVRGATARLVSNATQAEDTQSGVTAFNSDGFSLGSYGGQNSNGSTYAAWCWDAGTTTSSNGSGSITSTVRANASAGFSVATWTGSGSGSVTVGHGLGVAPQFFIVKDRSNARNWLVYHTAMGATKGIQLNLTTAQSGADAGYWNNTAPTSTVATIGTYGNESANYVGYFWTPVSGYSSFGSYTGNGSTTDGTFVYTGMRPRFVMLKRSDSTGNWVIWDSARNTYNVANSIILPNSSAAEYSPDAKIDFLSNGFKIRDNSSDSNASSATYVYACFSENPFSIARAR